MFSFAENCPCAPQRRARAICLQSPAAAGGAGKEGNMRIDKFLKVSRLIKRRTVANEVADAGRITVNGRPVKASYAVMVGD